MKKMRKILGVIMTCLIVIASGVIGGKVSAATVGDVLTSPESGWQRFDDTDKRIVYGSQMTEVKDSSCAPAYRISSYGSSFIQTKSYSNNTDANMNFKFYGTKLRIINCLNRSGLGSISKNTSVTIDGINMGNVLETYTKDIYINQAVGFETTGLKLGVHKVVINPMDGESYNIDAIDIDSNGYLVDPNSTAVQVVSLNQSNINLNVNDTATVAATVYPTNATNQDVTWSSSDTSIATVDSTGKITAVKQGTATITATTVDGGYTASCTVTVNDNTPKLDIQANQHRVSVGQEFTVNAVAENVYGVYAEDFKLSYDTKLFTYEGFEEIPGYKVYNTPQDNNGTLRFIIASQGKNYGINGNQAVVKLKLKAKAMGTGIVDGLKCRVADTTKEYDLLDANCLQDTIVVQGDVNRSGEYTLLDLAIDGYYYGMNASDTDTTKYDADQDLNGKVDDVDLTYIVSQMLNNTNYAPNNN